MQYRRAKSPRSTYFFTLVTHSRRPILCEEANIELLRDSFRRVIRQHPFVTDAVAILPDLFSSLSLDITSRRLIKSWFSRRCHSQYQGKVSASRKSKGEKAIWQRHFWEHLIRD